MPAVETATGPVDAAELGVTLMHEHVFVLNCELLANYPETWDEEARVAEAIERLDALREHGVNTLVDLTVLGLGRFVPRIRRVAEATAMQLVVATGLYAFHDVPPYFSYRLPAPPENIDPLTEMFVADITAGIGETGVRAAILKAATDRPGLTSGTERALRAIAQAHRETGVPITTHSHAPSEGGRDQQRVFAAEGVDLSRVIIGHCGDTTDLAYLTDLAGAGSYLGMDRFGVDPLLPFEQRVDTVAALCARGHAEQLLLSHDAACSIDSVPETLRQRALPNWHWTHIHDDVLPALRDRGVTDEQITQMLVTNPRRIFERQGRY